MPRISKTSGYALVGSSLIVTALASGCGFSHLAANGPTYEYVTIKYQNGRTSNLPPATDPAPNMYIQQSISDPEFNFSLAFDPNSYGYVIPTGPGEEEIDLFGAQLKSHNHMELQIIKPNANDVAGLNPMTCLAKPAPGTTAQGTVLLFHASAMGQSPAVCGFSGENSTANFYVQTPSSWYEVQFGTGGSQALPISMSAIEMIADSFKIDAQPS